MAEDNDAMAEEQTGTTLVFDIEHYADYEPFERVAEAIITRGDRKVRYVYDVSSESDEDELQVHAFYYLDGELKNESNTPQTHPVEDGTVYHTSSGQELRAFIEANAFADPDVSVTEEFESMVDL